MNVKTLKSLLIVFVLLVISTGCADKVYVDRVVEVKVPVKCIVPEVVCYAGQDTYTEEIKEMRLCIERHKQASEVCR